MTSMFGMNDEAPRSLRHIASEIFTDWEKMAANDNHPAHPWAKAMRGLETVDDQYGADSGKNIVRYFLSNAGTWRGETAKRVKAELKGMVGLK